MTLMEINIRCNQNDRFTNQPKQGNLRPCVCLIIRGGEIAFIHLTMACESTLREGSYRQGSEEEWK